MEVFDTKLSDFAGNLLVGGAILVLKSADHHAAHTLHGGLIAAQMVDGIHGARRHGVLSRVEEGTERQEIEGEETAEREKRDTGFFLPFSSPSSTLLWSYGLMALLQCQPTIQNLDDV